MEKKDVEVQRAAKKLRKTFESADNKKRNELHAGVLSLIDKAKEIRATKAPE